MLQKEYSDHECAECDQPTGTEDGDDQLSDVRDKPGDVEVDKSRDVEGKDEMKDEGDPPRYSEEDEHRDAESDSLYLDDGFADEVVTRMIEYKSKVFECASKNIKEAQERMKKDYNRKRDPSSVSYRLITHMILDINLYTNSCIL